MAVNQNSLGSIVQMADYFVPVYKKYDLIDKIHSRNIFSRLYTTDFDQYIPHFAALITQYN